jgi:putative spermidine/putrescine transport system ATP-binding protein
LDCGDDSLINIPMSFLRIQGLSKSFGSHAAVDGLDLEVSSGELIALLGPSGCGKTTTLQMVAGFVVPDRGAVTLAGDDLLRIAPHRRGLGIVFQSYALFPHMTTAENVAFGLDMQRMKGAARAERVRAMLDLVGLAAFADRYPRQLSGGQQQRVALARALAIRPRLLLLDEPLSNLDAKLREEMQIELHHLLRSLGTTTILVTHDQAEAMALADRIAVMNAGRLEQVGSPSAIYERPLTAFVAHFLGRSNNVPVEIPVGEAAMIIGDERWPLPDTLMRCKLTPGKTSATIRPEKIQFASDASDCGFHGTVRTRVFQGHHWLYQIDTPCGLLTVIRQNTGEPAPGEGDAVCLAWRVQDMTFGA